MVQLYSPRHTSANILAPTKAGEVVGEFVFPGWVPATPPEVPAAVVRNKALYVSPSSTPPSASVSVGVIAGDTIIVGFYLCDALAAATVSDSAGNTYNEVGNGVWAAGGGGVQIHVFYAKAATSGNIRVYASGTGTYAGLAVHTVVGLEDSLASVLDAYTEVGETVAGTYHSTLGVTPSTASSYMFNFWGEVGGDRPYTLVSSLGFRHQLYEVGVGVNDKFVESQGVVVGNAVETALTAYYANILCAFKVKQTATALQCPSPFVASVSSVASSIALALVAQASLVSVSSPQPSLRLGLSAQPSIVEVVAPQPTLLRSLAVPSSSVSVSAPQPSLRLELATQSSTILASSTTPTISRVLLAPPSNVVVDASAANLRVSLAAGQSTAIISSQPPRLSSSLKSPGASSVIVSSQPATLGSDARLLVPSSYVVVGGEAPTLSKALHTAPSSVVVASFAPLVYTESASTTLQCPAPTVLGVYSGAPSLRHYLHATTGSVVVGSYAASLHTALPAPPSSIVAFSAAPSLTQILIAEASQITVNCFAPVLRDSSFVLEFNPAREALSDHRVLDVGAARILSIDAEEHTNEVTCEPRIREVAAKRRSKNVQRP